MGKIVFVVAHGSTILGQSETRDDGIGYLKETYGEEKFVPDNYFPKCQGLLEEFNYDDNEKKFRLIEVRDNGIDLKSLLRQASKKKITRIFYVVIVEIFIFNQIRLISIIKVKLIFFQKIEKLKIVLLIQIG